MREDKSVRAAYMFVGLTFLLMGALYLWQEGPISNARQNTAWEYLSIDPKELVNIEIKSIFSVTKEERALAESQFIDAINNLGSQGWELCLEVNGAMIFKRPK